MAPKAKWLTSLGTIAGLLLAAVGIWLYCTTPTPKVMGTLTPADVCEIRKQVSHSQEWVLALTPSLSNLGDVAGRVRCAYSPVDTIDGAGVVGGRASIETRDRFDQKHRFVYDFKCYDTNRWEMVRVREVFR
jgi:hypothetical protein